MGELEEILKKYNFFDGKEYEIFAIQDYGRKSKFKLKMEGKYYTLILSEERIKPYVNKIALLGDEFKKIIGFRYLSDDNKVLILDYFGNGKGIDLVKIDSTLVNNDYELQLKNILDYFHSIKQDYVDFSINKYKNWKDYYFSEISNKIIDIYKQNLITDDMKKTLLEKLEESSKRYIDFQTTFIHADVTPLNVCINKEENSLYLIDYDDFKIGDPLMDISRIINCKDMSKVFKLLVDKYYYQYENNINHLFYTLRVNINWYNHIIEKKQEAIYNLNKAREDIFYVIENIIKHT
ncbi:MAG: phosphotransferase [Bacilli bacterium]|nr:phosphotransferase [Bacilli bacterium]